MNIVSKATLIILSLILLSGAGADTNDIVKQVKVWGTDLERRLETAEDSNAKLQKQLDKVTSQLQSSEADRDTLKDELVQSRRALKAAEKAAESANRRADKADRELARAEDRAKSDVANLMPNSKPAVIATPIDEAVKAPLAAPVVQQPAADAVPVVEVPAAIKDQVLSLTPAAPVNAAVAPAENQAIVVDGVLIPASPVAPTAAVKELPTSANKLLKDTAIPKAEEKVEVMMTTEDDDTE